MKIFKKKYEKFKMLQEYLLIMLYEFLFKKELLDDKL